MSENQPTDLWGTFSGTLILRKMALVFPDLPTQAQCIVNGNDPTAIPIVKVKNGTKKPNLTKLPILVSTGLHCRSLMVKANRFSNYKKAN